MPIIRPDLMGVLLASTIALIGSIIGGAITGTMLYADISHRLASLETDSATTREDLKSADRRLNEARHARSEMAGRLDLLTWRLDHGGHPPNHEKPK